jgi:hypothetical protein
MFENIEWLLILVVVGLQVYFFLGTLKKIKSFKDIFPGYHSFLIEEKVILESDLKKIPLEDLINNIDKYDVNSNILNDPWAKSSNPQLESGKELIPDKEGKKVAIDLLRVVGSSSKILYKITYSINTYLIRNKGAVSDFNLIKDITQRNVDAADEEIQLTLPVPIYLGLMGTMAGIIIGLFALPSITSVDFLEGGGIDTLIGGVKIAMFASLVGLSLTVFNSGYLFKGAKVEVESNKNDFFTFLQIELLPILSENVNSGIVGLNRNIEKFGRSFEKSVDDLEGIVGVNYQSILLQQEAIQSLKNMDISTIANFNVNVLTQLSKSVNAIEKLGDALNNVDGFLTNSRLILEQTGDVASLSQQLVKILEESKQLQVFLNSHFNVIEQRGQLINNTVASLDVVIAKSIEGLEQHTFERLQAIKDIKINAEDLLREEFDQNRNVLSKLKFIEPLKNDFNTFSEQGLKSQSKTLEAINRLISKIEENNKILNKVSNKLTKKSLPNRIKSIFVGEAEPID